MTPYNRILIYGLGLMGGSVALDLKRLRVNSGWPLLIDGVVRSPDSQAKAKHRQLADHIFLKKDFTLSQLASYDLILIAIPVAQSIDMLRTIPTLPKESVVIDMGSTKRELVRVYLEEKLYTRFTFIPTHPMAGTEFTGPQAAVEYLYKDKLSFLFDLTQQLPQEIIALHRKHLKRVEAFLRILGAIPFYCDPMIHDEVLAYLSHAPHILSSLIAAWAYHNDHVRSLTEQAPLPLTGGGFKDLVRIAGSNPEMWIEIIRTNRHAIIQSLQDFINHLNQTIALLQKGTPQQWGDFFLNAYQAKTFITEQEFYNSKKQ